jgi:predicted GH43/DUF377 family glycosyl hydrolase
MWYNGGNTATGVNGIGYATSIDGFSWIKNDAPVLTPGQGDAWDSSVVKVGSVVWNGTEFLMWYTGSNATSGVEGAVGLAMSRDGVSWVKYAGNPILNSSVIGLDEKYIASPYVVQLPLMYSMWYSGTGVNVTSLSAKPVSSILYASSLSNAPKIGLNWSKQSYSFLAPSSRPNAWDSGAVYSPSVLFDGASYTLWYTGLNRTLGEPQIGYATSPDAVTWNRSPLNPVLTPGAPGTWDSMGVEQPSAVRVGSALMLYYDGYSKNSVGIGLVVNSENPNLPTYSVNILEPLTTKAASGNSCPTVLPVNTNAGRAFHNGNVSGNYTYSQACAVKTVNN